LGVGGWSYGGILAVWAVGHSSRFKAGAPERFSFDYLSELRDRPMASAVRRGARHPWANEARYSRAVAQLRGRQHHDAAAADRERERWQLSPRASDAAYQRLKLKGVPTELVIYPDESHRWRSPSHYVDRLRRVTAWFGRYLESR
jgi:dipeptidyl aminopeptidase/acylaminoacyl peptidase